MKDPWLQFKCLDCKQCTSTMNEYYMVTTELWTSVVHERRGMLCVGCLEKRLGRTLNRKDFTNCPLNGDDTWMGEKSPRLRNRLGFK